MSKKMPFQVINTYTPNAYAIEIITDLTLMLMNLNLMLRKTTAVDEIMNL
jgi:hypothetical protein